MLVVGPGRKAIFWFGLSCSLLQRAATRSSVLLLRHTQPAAFLLLNYALQNVCKCPYRFPSFLASFVVDWKR